MYIEPKIESSYYYNNKGEKDTINYFYPKIGKTLYDYITDFQPKIIFEFGVLHGYSTISMAQALKNLGRGKIYGYDIWAKEKYGHGQTLSSTQKYIDQYNVSDYVDLMSGDIFDVLNSTDLSLIDLIHVDINNDGEKLGSIIEILQNRGYEGSFLFEGGIPERDVCWWMKNFNKTPMTSLKNKNNYVLLNENYPGISLIKKLKYEKK